MLTLQFGRDADNLYQKQSRFASQLSAEGHAGAGQFSSSIVRGVVDVSESVLLRERLCPMQVKQRQTRRQTGNPRI